MVALESNQAFRTYFLFVENIGTKGQVKYTIRKQTDKCTK